MSQAMTDDVIIAVRIASFYPFGDAARNEIVSSIADKMVELGHKHNFLVYKTSVQSKSEKNNG
jgi:hypothetical protein